MITHIHHINFLVKNLEKAIERYERLFGEHSFQRDELTQRAVITARTKLGDTWFVLVQPMDEDSIPARHLKQHGEGFFLLSLATNDLDLSKNTLERKLNTPFVTPVRKGLDNWKVLDFQAEHFFNAQLQLTQETFTE